MAVWEALVHFQCASWGLAAAHCVITVWICMRQFMSMCTFACVSDLAIVWKEEQWHSCARTSRWLWKPNPKPSQSAGNAEYCCLPPETPIRIGLLFRTRLRAINAARPPSVTKHLSWQALIHRQKGHQYWSQMQENLGYVLENESNFATKQDITVHKLPGAAKWAPNMVSCLFCPTTYWRLSTEYGLKAGPRSLDSLKGDFRILKVSPTVQRIIHIIPNLKHLDKQHNLIRPSRYSVQADTLEKSRHHLQMLELTGQHTQGRKHIMPSPRPWEEEHDSFPLVAVQPCLHNTPPWHAANSSGPGVRSRTRHVG